jgi:signal transduction histidine kinase
MSLLRSPTGSNRRYTLGVIAVALVGLAMLLLYVWWSSSAISDAIERSLAMRSRDVSTYYREKLEKAIKDRDPSRAQTWAELDPVLEEQFLSLPNLLGIVVRLPGGGPGAWIGPPERLASIPFLAPPESRKEMAVRVNGPSRELAQTTVAFLVPDDPRVPAAQVNVHLQFVPLAVLESTIFRLFQLGTMLVVVVIYLLAGLAFFINRQGARAADREREKAVRLKAIGEVAGAIAHELRNPLNAISLSFQVIGQSLQSAPGVEGARSADVGRARGEIQKISKVVDDFVSFARLSDLNVTEFDFAEVAREVFEAQRAACLDAAVQPTLTVAGATRMRGDREKIAQMLATTLLAVLDAVKARPGTLNLDVAGGRREVALSIRGRAERVDSRRLNNFTSLRRAWDEPVGLGLTIARTWIDCHGGRVSGGQSANGSAELAIVLPKRFV